MKRLSTCRGHIIIKTLAVSAIGIPCVAQHEFKHYSYDAFVEFLIKDNSPSFDNVKPSTIENWVHLLENECARIAWEPSLSTVEETYRVPQIDTSLYCDPEDVTVKHG